MRVPPQERTSDTAAADRAVLVGLVAAFLLVMAAALAVALWRDAFPQERTPTTTTTAAVELALQVEPPSSTTSSAVPERTTTTRASRGLPRDRAAIVQHTATTSLAPVSTTASTRPRQIAGVGYGPPAAYLGRFRVTCYGPPDFPAGKSTASGEPVGPGSIAVDPRVIPRGTRLRLDGVGDGHANDTGSAIRGPHVDVWRRSCAGWANPTVDVWRLP